MLLTSPPDLSPVPGTNGPGRQSPPDLYQQAMEAGTAHARKDGEPAPPEELGVKMLRLVKVAESTSDRYLNFVRKTWNQSYQAFRNQHFAESKYLSKEYRARSKIFRPKTRSAVRKAQAGITSSLFSTVDAIAIGPGNEADPKSRAAAALMQEIVNYRLDRTSGRNSIPWFKNAVGAAQNGQITGIVASKQEWKLKLKKVGEEPVMVPAIDEMTGQPILDPITGAPQEDPLIEVTEDPETGAEVEKPVTKPVYKTEYDRPDQVIIPSENIIIDSGADWTDPAQLSAFLGIKWPMKVQDIRAMENDPRTPWHKLSLSQLQAGKSEGNTTTTQGIRNAREGGTDPLNQVNQADEFSTVWVTEWFVRTEDDDYTFWAIGSQHLLTDPKPVEEVYPWNFGDRPITIGYAAIEAHKIFPMSPAQSWQQLQAEINDLANLTLDTVKMNIAPIAKVKRGRQVELDKLRARAPATNILMTDLTDVEFDKPPGVDAGAWAQMERLNVDFDTLAGQFDQGSVQTNRQLNETVGGMRLISGAANALQEFDQRVFFETWAEPSLAQIVRLCQFYEHDATILGLAGERAQLHQKFGVNEIDDALIEAQITLRIDVGVGAGDPQQRLAKFQMAVAAAMPLLQNHKKFVSGEIELDVEAVMQEAFGPAGYRDGGKRFLKFNPPPQGPNPMEQAELAAKQAEAAQKRSAATLNDAKAVATAQDSRLHALELIADLLGQGVDRQREDRDKAIEHAKGERERADGQQQRKEDRDDQREAGEREERIAMAGIAAKGGEGGARPKPKAQPTSAREAQDPGAGDLMAKLQQTVAQPREQQMQFIRDGQGRIAGAVVNGRKVAFQRGEDGRIAGMALVDGAPQRPQVALPPPNLSQLARSPARGAPAGR